MSQHKAVCLPGCICVLKARVCWAGMCMCLYVGELCICSICFLSLPSSTELCVQGEPVSQTLSKGSPFPSPPFPAPSLSPYRRRYIFHGSESFSWTSAFTALPRYCVGSPAPAWLPSPSVLMFSRLPRLALLLDIWNKNTDTASSPAHSHSQPQGCPTQSSVFKDSKRRQKSVQAAPTVSAEVRNTSLSASSTQPS